MQGISNEHFITVSLTMCLGSFVFLTGEGNTIRIETLVLAYEIARGE